jgi:hypothetical protein
MKKQLKLSYFLGIICVLFVILKDYLLIPLGNVHILNRSSDVYLFILSLLSFCIIIVGFLPTKRPSIKSISINIPFTVSWFLFVGSLVLSGFYYKTSLFLFIPFSFLFFILVYNSKYDDLYELFSNGIILSFIIIIILSLLFRPLNTNIYWGGRYSGMFTNPNVFALYLLCPYCAFLNKLHIKISEIGWDLKKIKFELISLSICSSFLIMSECRTALLAALITIIAYLILTIRNTHDRLKLIAKRGFTLLIITLVSLPIVFYSARYIPALVHNPIIYESEYSDINKMITSKDPINSAKYAKFIDFVHELCGRTDIEDKNLNSISTGRMVIYKAYLSQLSLRGHSDVGLEVYKGKYVVHAHDSYLQIAYTYGIIPGILFIVFSIFSCVSSAKYYLNNKEVNKYAIFPFLVIITFLIASMFENLSSPFLPLGFAFFIVQGPLFNRHLSIE